MGMQTKLELSSAREARWRKHLGTWRASGVSQAAYCRQHGLAPADFSWWKHELVRRDNRAAKRSQRGIEARPQFVPLSIAAGQTRSECELLLRNGRRLQIGSGAEPRWVAELAAALESGAPC